MLTKYKSVYTCESKLLASHKAMRRVYVDVYVDEASHMGSRRRTGISIFHPLAAEQANCQKRTYKEGDTRGGS